METTNQCSKLLYSINDAAEALSLSRATIYREMNEGRLIYVKYRKRRFVSRRALEDWVQARELETAGSRFAYVQEVARDCA